MYPYRRGNLITCGLRARVEDDVDVSVIAQRFGGGGHRKAAGFEL